MKRVLPVIVLSQFFCTSVWFAGNSVIADIIRQLKLNPGFMAHMISAVQLGFIAGTFLFAVLAISDRFSPSKVFFICSLLAAITNLCVLLATGSATLLLVRSLTGFFLAGIYPVGMKIASDHEQDGLARSLGFLVGALVLGTAFPHLLRLVTHGLAWSWVIYSTTALSAIGGLLIILFVPDGKHRHVSQPLRFNAFLSAFRSKTFRTIAFGYFGHSWELYAFWAFLPVMLRIYQLEHKAVNVNESLWSFLIISSGTLACIIAGQLSMRLGAKRVAMVALSISGLCCLLSPFVLVCNSLPLFLTFLFIWGLTVVGDSPLYSTLIARSAPPETRGTSLTIVNCIGFALTIMSIQVLNILSEVIPHQYLYLVLALGPLLGLLAMAPKAGVGNKALNSNQ